MDLNLLLKSQVFHAVLNIILVFAISYIAYRIIRLIINKYVRKITERTESRLDDEILDFVEKILFRSILIVALYFAGEELSGFSGDRVFFYFKETLYAVVILVVTTLLIKITNLVISFYLEKASKKTGSELKKDFGLLLQRIVQIVFFTTAAITILTHFNVDVKGLVATLGVGSLAIALAAQDTLSNMIAGFVIMVDRPFRVGDRIKTTSGVLGEVFEIGLRSMKLLDFEKNLHVIPNAEIVKAEVINYSYPDTKVRVKIEVGVAYGSDLEKVKKIMLDIFSKHQKVLKSPKPSVYFINFGESSLDLLGVAYVNHYKDSWETGEELRMQVYNSFNKNNIEIPFPQNVVYLHKDVE